MSGPERRDESQEGAGAAARPSSFFDRVTSALNGVGTVWIFALMVLINADIGGRALFSAPVRGVAEIVSLSIVGIVFLQLAHALRAGSITRSDAFFHRMIVRRRRLGHAFGAVQHFVGAFLFAVILWSSYPLFTLAWRDDLFVGAVGDFTAPTWPIKLIILIGCAAMSGQFLVLGWRDARQVLARRPAAAEERPGNSAET